MTSEAVVLRVLRIFVRWCDVATALIIYSKDVSAQDRAAIKLRLVELKEAVKGFEEEG